MTGAILPVGAVVGIAAVLADVHLRLGFLIENVPTFLQKSGHPGLLITDERAEICDFKQSGKVQSAVKDIFVVDADQKDPGDGYAAVLQYIFLVSDICNVNGRLGVSRALYLVNGPAGLGFPQKIHGAVNPLPGEGGLADDGGFVLHFFFCALDHPSEIQPAFLKDGDLHIGAKQPHGQVTHLISVLHNGLTLRVQHLCFRHKFIHPNHFGTLPQAAILGF